MKLQNKPRIRIKRSIRDQKIINQKSELVHFIMIKDKRLKLQNESRTYIFAVSPATELYFFNFFISFLLCSIYFVFVMLNKEQENLLRHVTDTQKNLFFTGPAGSGKVIE